MPDEEIGGTEGMMWFHLTPEFKALNVGVCVDEGLASPTEAFTVFYGERRPMWLKITGIEAEEGAVERERVRAKGRGERGGISGKLSGEPTSVVFFI